jgi:hypothetical protein
MTSADFEELKAKVLEAERDNPKMRAEYKVLKLSAMRYRWDLLWISGVKTTKYYDYLNDDHIDTALRKIVGS